MVVKVKDNSEKIGHIKINDKSKKYIPRGQKNLSYSERILSKKKSNNFTTQVVNKKAFDISRKGSNPVRHQLLQHILPQNNNITSHRV